MRSLILKPSLFENFTVAVSLVVLGLMAGFFWTYSFNVNLATATLDGATYAKVQSLFNQNVRHFSFFALFFGGAFFPLFALLVNYRHWKQLDFYLIALALLIYAFGIVLFTRQVNLPLNAYTESWNPSDLPADWASVRQRWNDANMLRVYFSSSSFVLCLSALVLRASRR